MKPDLRLKGICNISILHQSRQLQGTKTFVINLIEIVKSHWSYTTTFAYRWTINSKYPKLNLFHTSKCHIHPKWTLNIFYITKGTVLLKLRHNTIIILYVMTLWCVTELTSDDSSLISRRWWEKSCERTRHIKSTTTWCQLSAISTVLPSYSSYGLV